MGLLKKDKVANRYTIIIGCGRLGGQLASYISNCGEDVLIIDKDADAFRKLAPSFAGMTVVGDAQDLNVLDEVRISEAHQVVVVTNNDNTNVMIAQMVKRIYKVEDVYTRLQNPEIQNIFDGMNIQIILPSLLSFEKIKELNHD